MDTTAALAAQLRNIIQLSAKLPDPMEAITAPPAYDPSRHGGGAHKDGLEHHLDRALDFWNTLPNEPAGIKTRSGLEAWAQAWADSWWTVADDGGPRPSGDPLLWLAGHLSWAIRSFPAIGAFAEEVGAVEAVVVRLSGYGPVVTDSACPSCGSMLVHETTEQGVSEAFTCRDCTNLYTLEGLEAMRKARVTASDQLVTRKELTNILDVPSATIRSWIYRGQVQEVEGKIRISDATRMRNVA